MLDRETRTVILRLKAEGQGPLAIAGVLRVSPNTVRKVLEEGTAEVPDFSRSSSAEPHQERIEELYTCCQGNLVRVHEELESEGISIPYSTLTGFCRRAGIGVKPKKRSGRYHFQPGEEMQHDTSPHRVEIGCKKVLMQCASVVLCFSRMLYAQLYPTFNRFYCMEQLLKGLGLRRIQEIIKRELERAADKQSSYTDFLARLLREEYLAKQERSMMYRIKQAKIPEPWTLETFPFKEQTGVKKAAIMQLAELDFIPSTTNIVFIGETAVGKTGLASSILRKALENGYRGRFIKAQDLFDEMYESLADRSTRRLINQLANIDLLLIDEMGYLNLSREHTNIFFRLMEERYNRKSTIITTNLDYDEWYDFLGNKKMVEALLSRLRHHCRTIRIDGPPLRNPDEEAPQKKSPKKKINRTNNP
jgi:DNA replication protein DnaC